MNIININYEKLSRSVNEYIMSNNTLYACPDGYIKYEYNKPIILMNNDTLNFLKEKNKYYIKEKTNKDNLIFDCHIAIANWLPFGEVELK